MWIFSFSSLFHLDSHWDFGVHCARKNILPTFSFIYVEILPLHKAKYRVFAAFHLFYIYICENSHPPEQKYK